MEANKNNNVGVNHHHHHKEEEDDDELLKIRISSHPLYERLVENHLNCLKVGGIGDRGRNNSKSNQRKAEHSISTKINPCCSSMQLNQSELDLFMEGYCSALSKLKEAMEEPQQQTIAFINGMHSQLRDLARPTHLSPDVFLAETERNNSKYVD
ncbi:hypothetical protein E1A91_A12G294800v1 [Gossypium mustelinum]|uniref:KNOX1 domain-containing protein n=1 Tax=Gossypium mustelinum TaxID=34275 RepID=A0A5D2WZW2_GOSMU|nr:hypothetical protein E1A91_A12G294800v1 [Gossypium mustelinum]